jgi:ATP-dependent DNA helicase RecG
VCVIDEQHRFGVVQRAKLKQKGPVEGGVSLTPHLLVMTATPIPRSLALTVYGDLTVSVLDELPPGRTPVRTEAIADLGRAHDAIAATLAKNERAFVVYPLIDENEDLDLEAATSGFEDLVKRFGAHDVALLHGRMDAAAREQAMARFAAGEVHVLVSTTVIEVGVDVPEATLMTIVNAERFGLSQLHQLRGRVGRSHRPSSCLLVVGNSGQVSDRRIAILEDSNDGFRIAEEDLAIRGPGDVLGTRQSGLPSLAFSDFVRHAPLIELSRTLADALVQADPQLARPEHHDLRLLVVERYAERLALTGAG